ncbi:alpha/beta-hydrolase [Fomitiporia mediterranea MF3/22]|uniref:alpha/beta-hydrolase n=1 Tax=Fomitiporia mediterranea (strain MF3/22) TaxID=694068 RepID=UPI0004408616|nr:alpha/beta-hydrolase [Fomitiporia mediterranea MF3/22]EJD02233.1 alpha/beta-hydrolase [Fomitiporia mediterranea MF3/22]
MVWALFIATWLLTFLPSSLRAFPTQASVRIRAEGDTVSVSTSLGNATGVPDTNSVTRFSVRYASADRWKPSVITSSWNLPNNLTDPSATPRACPQIPSSENSADTDEDCLSMILYVPTSGTDMPTMMWIHGGSFVVGSATGPGLDGSTLAQATNSIVAVIQYRLGAFGFLSPSRESNLAVNDVINALRFLQTVVPSFNGDANKITIAGQSSGASMVRALLATPSASGFFQSAILQSDPMDYGFLSTRTFNTLNDFFVSQLQCSASDTDCLAGLSTDDILNASMTVFGTANSLDPSAGSFEPMRPVKDGSLITSALDLTESFPGQSKQLLITTVRDEAGPAIYGNFTTAVAESEWDDIVNATLGSTRAAKIVNSSFYAVPAVFAANTSAFDARIQLEGLGTDQIWRCPSWSFARSWASAGGKVFVGVFAVGATYPDNSAIPFCTQGVCHENDIEIVFGTVNSPSSAQSSLISSIQARYKAFLAGDAPDASWQAVSGDDTNAIILGGTSDGSRAVVGACDPSFWGSAVQYDYQIFNA